MIKKVLFTSFLVIFITGCVSSVPKCSSTEAIDLVKEVTNKKMVDQIGVAEAKKLSYSINIIRTTDKNEKTGAFECAAVLEIDIDGTDEVAEVPITYSIENLDNGKEFYIKVWGL